MYSKNTYRYCLLREGYAWDDFRPYPHTYEPQNASYRFVGFRTVS